MLLEIWTQAYRPFSLGGVHSPIKITTLIDQDPVELGKGFAGYVIFSPVNRKHFIVEARSGGIVGDDLKMVRADVKSAPKHIMEKQVLEAIEQRKQAREVSSNEFWSSLGDA